VIFDDGPSCLLARLRAADVRPFLDGFDALIAAHGCRGPNEWEISSDTWETRPELVLVAIDRVRRQSDEESPRIRNRRLADARDVLTAELRASVAGLGDDAVAQFEGALVAANQLAFRERTKTNLVRVVHEIRMVFRELGGRHLDDPTLVYMLLADELEQFVADPASPRATLAERALTWRELWDLEPPYFIRDGIVPPLGQWQRRGRAHHDAAVPSDVLHGVAGCPGTVTGRARIVTDPAEPGDLGPGDILVAPLTDPSWTPLFMAVSGVVVDVGGQVSHAVIVGRELGLPCVVSPPARPCGSPTALWLKSMATTALSPCWRVRPSEVDGGHLGAVGIT
jgi:rifampicin phosphotransferase